jgi:hypothetical protein
MNSLLQDLRNVSPQEWDNIFASAKGQTRDIFRRLRRSLDIRKGRSEKSDDDALMQIELLRRRLGCSSRSAINQWILSRRSGDKNKNGDYDVKISSNIFVSEDSARKLLNKKFKNYSEVSSRRADAWEEGAEIGERRGALLFGTSKRARVTSLAGHTTLSDDVKRRLKMALSNTDVAGPDLVDRRDAFHAEFSRQIEQHREASSALLKRRKHSLK